MTFDETTKQKAEEFLSQFCIAPGTPHWIAGERDFTAGRESVKESLAIAVRALEEFQLGHKHEANEPHIRILGDSYGYCDYCHGKVEFGPGFAEQTLALIRERGDFP